MIMTKQVGHFHRYRKSLNRLLKVCCVSATRTVLIAFFSSFLLQPLTVLMNQTRQPVCAVKQSIYLDVYGHFKCNLEKVNICLHRSLDGSTKEH